MPAHSVTITVATVNDNEFSKGSNYPDVADCDVVLIQEGRGADYDKLVDLKTHGVLQDRTNLGTSGSVIIWALAFILSQKTGLTFGVKAAGLLTRWLAWLRCTVGGRRVLFIAAHRPPKRASRFWHPFDLALAARVRRALLFGRVVIVGIDANQRNPQALARLCGLTWHSTDSKRIDGFMVSRSVTVKSIKALPKDTSDHQPVVAVMEIALKFRPDPPRSYPPIAAARNQSHKGPEFGVGECLERVRKCYDIALGFGSAAKAWFGAKHKHPGDLNPPRGCPVFWTGGSHGDGHVAISAGAPGTRLGNRLRRLFGRPRETWIWSTDILRDGFFDYVPLSLISQKWGLTYAGWTEDLNGVAINPTKGN